MDRDELIRKLTSRFGVTPGDAETMIGIAKPVITRRAHRTRQNNLRRNGFYRSKDNRLAIWGRDEGHCAMCGEFVPLDEMTIGHVIPVSKGGKSDWYNCQTECEPCNVRKGDDILPRLAFAPTQPPADGGR